MKHAVLGAGGVGGLLAGALAHAGEHVVLLVRRPARAQHNGVLRLERPHETIEARVSIETMLTVPVDILWIAVKAQQLVPALREIPRTPTIGSIVPLLNGIDHVPLLRSLFTRDQVVPATILVSSERVAPGRIVQHSPFANLEISAVGAQRLRSAAARLGSTGFSVEFVADEKTMLWRKLAFLAPLALTGAASDKDKEGIFSDELWRTRLESALGETCAVALADGATLSRTDILAALKGLPPGMRSSLQKDVSARVLPELDGIGGAIIRSGRRHGIDVPVIRELVAEIERRLQPLSKVEQES